MGFFKSIGKAITSVVKQPAKAVSSLVRTVVNDPVRASLAVATAGASEVARTLPGVGSVVKSGTAVASGVYGAAANVYTAGLYGQVSNLANKILTPQGGQPMAFNVGQFLGGVQNAFGGSSNPYLAGAGQVANIASSFFAPSASVPSVQVTSPVVYASSSNQQVAVRPSGGTSLTKEVFDAGVKVLGRLGIPYRATSGAFSSTLKRALGSIASLARRTPAGTIVGLLAGLGLTAMEANLLTAWHAQRRRHRRMNPANSKALRRAARRIKSFHKLCQVTDLLKSRGGSRRKCKPTC